MSPGNSRQHRQPIERTNRPSIIPALLSFFILTASGQQAGQSKAARLTSKQDTVIASVTTRTAVPASSSRTIERPIDPAYTTQRGAFNKAQNAPSYQKLAKERFSKNSVHNRYEPLQRLCRVSIGKFTTSKEAAVLRREIMKQYPREYSEAWVNYIAK